MTRPIHMALDGFIAANGRVLIPFRIRKALLLEEHSPLLIIASNDAITIKRLDGEPFVPLEQTQNQKEIDPK